MACEEASLRPVLGKLRDLFALHHLEKGRAWFLENGVLPPRRARLLPAAVDILCANLRREAIIEEGDKHIVYVQQQPGLYLPQEIHTGIQGELYTQVLDGAKDGDQVVTFGSFFIDAEQKLKGTAHISQPPRHP